MWLKIVCFSITSFLVFGINFMVNFLQVLKVSVQKDEGCFVKHGILAGEDQTRWNDKAALTGSANRMNWFKRVPQHIS